MPLRRWLLNDLNLLFEEDPMEDGISQGHHSNKLMFTLFGKSEGLDDAQPSWIESTIPRLQLM